MICTFEPTARLSPGAYRENPTCGSVDVQSPRRFCRLNCSTVAVQESVNNFFESPKTKSRGIEEVRLPVIGARNSAGPEYFQGRLLQSCLFRSKRVIGADDLESHQLRPFKDTQLAALKKGNPLLAQSIAGDLAIT